MKKYFPTFALALRGEMLWAKDAYFVALSVATIFTLSFNLFLFLFC